MCSWQCGGCGVWHPYLVSSCECSKLLHSAQQLKPEIPSFEKIWKRISPKSGFGMDDGDQHMAQVGAQKCYDAILIALGTSAVWQDVGVQ